MPLKLTYPQCNIYREYKDVPNCSLDTFRASNLLDSATDMGFASLKQPEELREAVLSALEGVGVGCSFREKAESDLVEVQELVRNGDYTEARLKFKSMLETWRIK